MNYNIFANNNTNNISNNVPINIFEVAPQIPNNSNEIPN